MEYRIFETPQQVVESLADTMRELSRQHRAIHISLSGGSTPKLLFKTLASTPYQTEIEWSNLHFWWGDERCVAPSDPESNFGEANTLLFQHIDIPTGNLHRIVGEREPEAEALRFCSEMEQDIPQNNGLPEFDWILLGMGEDGHTASLFPDKTDFSEQALAILARHPQTGQVRVSKSARLIKNAKRITYLVLGESKAEIIKQIQTNSAEAKKYPAAQIQSNHGQTEWFLDLQAAKLLPQGE